MSGADIEILEIDAGPSCPGGEASVVQGHSDDEVVGHRDARKSARLRPEERAFEHHVVDLDFAACALVLRELTYQLDQDGDISPSRCTYHLLDRIRHVVSRADPGPVQPGVCSCRRGHVVG